MKRTLTANLVRSGLAPLLAIVTTVSVLAATTNSDQPAPDTAASTTEVAKAQAELAAAQAKLEAAKAQAKIEAVKREASAPVPGFKAIKDDSDDDSVSDLPTIIHIDTHHDKNGSMFDEAAEALIPIIAILMTFGTPIAIVATVFYFRHRRRQQNLTLAREFLAKGMPVPPQLLDDSVRNDVTTDGNLRTRSQYDMRRGIKYLAIGVGISLALYFDSPHGHAWAWGLILIVMGLGYMLSSIIESGRKADGPAPFLPPPPKI